MPKPYIRKVPAAWWLKKSAYFYFMLRELTAVVMAAYCVLLLVMLWCLKQGSVQYANLLDLLQTPWSIALHFLACVAALYHTYTWFALAPKVLVIRLGEEKVPPGLLIAAHWVLWCAVLAALLVVIFVLGPKL
jgi:fumarate reductase subunit C